jgi:predicted ATPase
MSQARSSRVPKILAIEGDSGIGKSRLVCALREAARAHGWLGAQASCHEIQTSIPLAAVRALAGSLVEALGERRAKYLTGIDALVSASAEPEALLKGLQSLIEGTTLDFALLLVVDDAQWLDDRSRAAIAQTIRQLGDRPIVVLLAHRPHSDSLRNGLSADVTQVLEPLSDVAAAHIVETLAPNAPDDVARAIVEHARGYAINLVSLAEAAARGELTSVDGLVLTRRALVAQDLRRMPAELRQFLQVCALIDGLIDNRLMQALWPCWHRDKMNPPPPG